MKYQLIILWTQFEFLAWLGFYWLFLKIYIWSRVSAQAVARGAQAPGATTRHLVVGE